METTPRKSTFLEKPQRPVFGFQLMMMIYDDDEYDDDNNDVYRDSGVDNDSDDDVDDGNANGNCGGDDEYNDEDDDDDDKTMFLIFILASINLLFVFLIKLSTARGIHVGFWINVRA